MGDAGDRGAAPPQPTGAGDGTQPQPLLVRLAEQLADARARLSILEQQAQSRIQSEDARFAGLQVHLERQDDMTNAVQAKLDAILLERAEERRQRDEDRTERRQASRTMIRTVLLMVPSGLLSAIATAMPAQLRIGVFATACVCALGAILWDVLRGATRA